MKNLFFIGLKLTIICGAAALLLGMVNAVTAPRIEELKEIILQRALSVVIIEGEAGKEILVDDKVVHSFYPVILENRETAGYILTLIGNGYAGDMKILANYEKSGKLVGTVLLDNSETPGLGKEAAKEGYMDKFIGTGDNKPVPTRKRDLSLEDADSISGSTVTFAGIAKALEYGSDFVKKIGDQS